MKKWNVCFVTGTRAEFGIWRPVLDALRASPLLRPRLLVTGMHLLPAFGNTWRDIDAAGYAIDARVPMYPRDMGRPGKRLPSQETAAAEPPAGALARGIRGMASAFATLKADLVMVLGDRLEMLAAANAALAQRIPLAHLHGGEIAPGQWDEQIRHAITKMAHLHFCATKTAGERIIRMGEPPRRVHVVGAPAIDTARAFAAGLEQVFPVDDPSHRIMPLLVLHPSGSAAAGPKECDQDALEYRRALMVIDAIRRQFPADPLSVIGPNNDPGHAGILKAYRDRADQLLLEMSVPQETFWAEMAAGGLLVGNSSSGIIEAATFGVPVINIGPRQAGRERSGNVLDVDYNPTQIENALRKAAVDRPFRATVARRTNVYGDGHAAPRIVAVLERLARDLAAGRQRDLLAKRFWEPPAGGSGKPSVEAGEAGGRRRQGRRARATIHRP